MPWIVDECGVSLRMNDLMLKWRNVWINWGSNCNGRNVIKGFEPLFECCVLMRLVCLWKMEYFGIIALITRLQLFHWDLWFQMPWDLACIMIELCLMRVSRPDHTVRPHDNRRTALKYVSRELTHQNKCKAFKASFYSNLSFWNHLLNNPFEK